MKVVDLALSKGREPETNALNRVRKVELTGFKVKCLHNIVSSIKLTDSKIYN